MRSWLVVAALVVVLVLLVLAIWLLPPMIVEHDMGSGGPKASLSEVQRVAAIASSRQELLWAAGGLIAVITLAFTWQRDRVARQRADLDRDANFTTRYTEAIKQLGDENLAVRLGGVYALERIAIDSVRDRQTILDVLTAYLRAQPIPAWTSEEDPPLQLAEDESAAATVLGRITQMSPPSHVVNLYGVFLGEADLTGADLSHANLSGANFTEAGLNHAHLNDAYLSAAILKGADLTDAILINANLSGAYLRGAILNAANLKGADLTDAYLTDAIFDDRTQWPEGFEPSAA